MQTYSQDWGLHWISCPTAEPTDQVWFRRTLLFDAKPASAHLTIATKGKYILYMNGYNVSTDVLLPYSPNGNDTVSVTTYEVARFMRADTNVVAVWYSPSVKYTDKQLSLTLWGTTEQGGTFAYSTNGTWLCRTANGKTTVNGDEIINGTTYLRDWNRSDFSIMGWLPAKETTGYSPSPIVITPLIHTAERITRIYRYMYFDDYGKDIAYTFPRRFDGWVRVTLRNMQRGDTISVNGLRYVCNGEMDEQACRRFTKSQSNIAVISGDSLLSRENNIMNVEAINIEPRLHDSYMY